MREPVGRAAAPPTAHEAGPDRSSEWKNDDTLYVAVVQTPREICFVTAATSDSALEERLASYVREHAAYQLWPDHARRVEELLAAGDTRAAVWLYFDSTGTRWDRERLCIEVVEPATARGPR